VDIPDAVKDELHRRMAPYRGRMPEARWTRPENWHVTIKFLGATYPRLVTEVESAVDAAARVLWAGLEDKGECLASAARDLDERLCEHFKPEARGLTPHLTLARLRTPINLEDAAPAWIGFPVASAPFTIDRLVLYRSHLSPRGARYEPTYQAPFGGG
jgi:2'-5' RNA ligase